jgi:uncharacterized protein (DUF2384 family)
MKQRLLEVQGIRAFARKDRFYKWMNAPCPALGGKIPAKLTGTPEGFQIVLDELVRIEYGVFS